MVSQERQTSRPAPPEAPEPVLEEQEAPAHESLPDPIVTFERIERLLSEIHGALDAGARERRHREFSATRLIGAILQIFVIGLLALAAIDWLFRGPPYDTLLVKLSFAAVLQLTALTAFVVSRERG